MVTHECGCGSTLEVDRGTEPLARPPLWLITTAQGRARHVRGWRVRCDCERRHSSGLGFDNVPHIIAHPDSPSHRAHEAARQLRKSSDKFRAAVDHLVDHIDDLDPEEARVAVDTVVETVYVVLTTARAARAKD
jgi:hypothetical protein